MARSKKKSSKPLSTEAEYWLSEDCLLLLECWARDGYTYQDIANRIGVSERALSYWRKTYPEIDNALARGREVVDYMVENALLKSALGYKTKEVKVTTVVQMGQVVETIKEETEKEQAPNVSAIQCWLYNRKSKTWKNMNSRSNMIEDLVDEDTSIKIEVTRAGSKNNEQDHSNSTTNDELEDTWTLSEDGEETEVNSSITISKMSPEEAETRRKAKEKKKKEENALQTKVDYDPDDLDYWPDDWQEEE